LNLCRKARVLNGFNASSCHFSLFSSAADFDLNRSRLSSDTHTISLDTLDPNCRSGLSVRLCCLGSSRGSGSESQVLTLPYPRTSLLWATTISSSPPKGQLPLLWATPTLFAFTGAGTSHPSPQGIDGGARLTPAQDNPERIHATLTVVGPDKGQLSLESAGGIPNSPLCKSSVCFSSLPAMRCDDTTIFFLLISHEEEFRHWSEPLSFLAHLCTSVLLD
jgi:hypothetical protein